MGPWNKADYRADKMVNSSETMGVREPVVDRAEWRTRYAARSAHTVSSRRQTNCRCVDDDRRRRSRDETTAVSDAPDTAAR